LRDGEVYRIATHGLLHAGMLSAIVGCLSVTLFGSILEEAGFGARRLFQLVGLSLLAGAGSLFLPGCGEPVWGSWGISTAFATALALQDVESICGGWTTRVASTAYVILCLFGLPAKLSGENSPTSLAIGGIAAGLLLGGLARRRG
jgi:hypothetical protein